MRGSVWYQKDSVSEKNSKNLRKKEVMIQKNFWALYEYLFLLQFICLNTKKEKRIMYQ